MHFGPWELLVVHGTGHPLLFGIDWMNPGYLLDRFGDFALWGAALVIFAECGLLIGFFLPGDSLLFTVGLLVSQGQISYPLWVCAVVLSIAAVLGNACGYGIGHKAGPRVFQRGSATLFKPKYVDRTREFFDRYGNRAIVLARFVPVVRTFITVMAGVGSMGLRRFLTYSAVGGVLWATGVTLLGNYLGQVSLIRQNIELMLAVFVAIAVVPVVLEYVRGRFSRTHSAGRKPGRKPGPKADRSA